MCIYTNEIKHTVLHQIGESLMIPNVVTLYFDRTRETHYLHWRKVSTNRPTEIYLNVIFCSFSHWFHCNGSIWRACIFGEVKSWGRALSFYSISICIYSFVLLIFEVKTRNTRWKGMKGRRTRLCDRFTWTCCLVCNPKDLKPPSCVVGNHLWECCCHAESQHCYAKDEEKQKQIQLLGWKLHQRVLAVAAVFAMRTSG